MEKTHRILQLMILLKIIDISDFYAITINEPDLHLQGYFKSNGLSQRLGKLFPNLKLNKEGFVADTRVIQGKRIEITLT